VRIEVAFIERFVGVHKLIAHQGNPKVGNREMALRRDEDVSGLQVAVYDGPIVEFVHAQGLLGRSE
jgi:hypothetical protein